MNSQYGVRSRLIIESIEIDFTKCQHFCLERLDFFHFDQTRQERNLSRMVLSFKSNMLKRRCQASATLSQWNILRIGSRQSSQINWDGTADSVSLIETLATAKV